MAKKIIQEFELKTVGIDEQIRLTKEWEKQTAALIKLGEATSVVTLEEFKRNTQLDKRKRKQSSIDKGEKTRLSNIQIHIDLLKSLNNKQNINNDQMERVISLMTKQNKLEGEGNKKRKKSISWWKKLWGVLKKVVGFFYGLYKAMGDLNKVIQETVVAYDSLEYSMKTILQSAPKMLLEMGYLNEITKSFGGTLINTSKSYIKFKQAADSANLVSHDTQKIFRSVSKAGAVMGLSNDALTGTMLALEQMLSKGKLSAEELRRQLGERLPGAYNIMARSIGVSSAALDDLLRKGEILSSDVLPRFAEQLEKEYKISLIDEVDKLGVSIDVMSQEWTDFGRTIFDSEKWIYKTLNWMYEKIGQIGGLMAMLARDEVETAKFTARESLAAKRKAHDSWYKYAKEENETYRQEQIDAVNAEIISERDKANKILKINEETNNANRKLWNDRAKELKPEYDKAVKIAKETQDKIDRLIAAGATKEQKDLIITKKEKILANDEALDKIKSTTLKHYTTLKEMRRNGLNAEGKSTFSNAQRKERNELFKIIAAEKEKGVMLNQNTEHLNRQINGLETIISQEGNLSELKKDQLKGLMIEGVYQDRDVADLLYKTELMEKGAIIVKNSNKSARDTYFIEKQLYGLEMKKIAIKKDQINLQKILQKADFTSIAEKEAAYIKELQLFTELKDAEVKKEEKVRKNWAAKETERLMKTIGKNQKALQANSKATFKYSALNAKGEYETKIFTHQKALDYIDKLERDYTDWVVAINKKADTEIYNNKISIQENILNMKISEEARLHSLERQNQDNEFQTEMTNLNLEFTSGKMFAAEYYRKKHELEDGYSTTVLSNEERYSKQQLKNLKEKAVLAKNNISIMQSDVDLNGGDEKTAKILELAKLKLDILLKQIADAEKKLGEAASDLATNGVKNIQEQFSNVLSMMSEIGSIASDLDAVFEAFHERDLQRIEEKKEAQDKMYEDEMFKARDNAAKQELLKRNKVLADRKIEKEKRKVEYEGAKRARAFAIFQIELNTAMAVMNALGTVKPYPLAIAMAITAGIAGALQLTAVMAAPLPKLKQGRQGGPATYAVVGDGGRHEVIERASGGIELTPKTDTVTWLNKGDKVHKSISDYEKKSIKNHLSLSLNNGVTEGDDVEGAIRNGFKKAKITTNIKVVPAKIDFDSHLWMLQQSQF